MREIEAKASEFRPEDEVLVFLGIVVGVGGHGCGVWVETQHGTESVSECELLALSVRELEVVRDALEQLRPRVFVDAQP